MLLHIPAVLDPAELTLCTQLLQDASWADGRITAGTQSAQVKNNQQLAVDNPAAATLGNLVLNALSKNAQFFTAALPKRIHPPLFNRYHGINNAFGNHVDNAIRASTDNAQYIRTDLSFTLFLSELDSYDGGELIIEDGYTGRAIKLPAGDLILYPSSSIHRVAPVTRGTRLACFSWLESMIRAPEHRDLLFNLDMSILTLRHQHGDNEATLRLTNCYHNLMRMWADV
ncbi:MAG: Fe2+-dependent dioxygenase [Sulfuriferula sp.]|nr:Fe2+-dependent dioxygenase [Sulfuriferula sp.]